MMTASCLPLLPPALPFALAACSRFRRSGHAQASNSAMKTYVRLEVNP